jgi:hypothetical protein
MSRDKRKLGPLDSFVTISKKTLITPLSSEGSGPDHSQLSTLEVAQPIGGEFEEPDSADPCDVNQSLNIIDSHPDTHENDIGFQLSLNSPLTDETKHSLLAKPFRPDRKYTFPVHHDKNGAVRRFMATWLVQHPFLSYSPYYEGAFCSACSLFSPSASNQSAVLFVHYPCSRFHHLKHFTKLIQTHLKSENHKLAILRATNFVRTFENPSFSIDDQLDRNRIEVVERNKSILLSIIKVVITCGRQNIALRGHRGNFISRK